MACGLILCLAPAATAAEPTRGRIARVRDLLEDAENRAGDVDREVAAARSALALADDELATSTTRLDAVEQELGRALGAHRKAQAETAATAGQLQQAELGLQRSADELTAQHRQFDERVASTYMYGDRRTGLLSSVNGAGTPQELATALRYLRSTQVADRTMIDAVAAATGRAQQERAAVEALRQRRIESEQMTLDQRYQAEYLVRRQADLVAQVQQQRHRRREILDGLREDSAAAEALARQLSQQVERLMRQLAAKEALDRIVAPPPAATLDLGAAPAWTPLLPDAGRAWAPGVTAAAGRAGVDPRLFAALVWAESAFQPAARSTVGAVGLAQLMPATAAGLGVDPRDPLQNLDGGARYLAAQVSRFRSVHLGVAAYNAGPGAVQRYGGVPPYPETQAYVIRVLSHYEQLGRS